jgi:hypothetical protein
MKRQFAAEHQHGEAKPQLGKPECKREKAYRQGRVSHE